MMAAVNYASPLVTKPSRAEWLGAVPVDWEIKKMKYLFRDHSQKGQPDATLLSVTQGQGVVPRTWVENRMVMPSGNLESFKFIKKDDFAISLRSFEGGLEYCHHDGIISPAYTVLKRRHSNLDSGYYRYLFKSHAFISELQTSVVGIREGKNISFEELSYSLMPIPPLSAQRSIAVFLDDKCAKIDEAVKIKEDQIALLHERRKIIIQNAVMRGLNSDIALKDSGIDWIGQIPTHWRITRLGVCLQAAAGRNRSDLPLLSITRELGVIERNVEDQESNHNFIPEDLSNYRLLRAGQFGMNKMKAWQGSYGISPITGIVSPAYFVFDLKTDVDPAFFNLALRTGLYVSFFYQASDGVRIGQWDLSRERMKQIPFVIPSQEEQLAIVRFAAEQTQKINAAIDIKVKQISALKEYKSSLINAAVTGKIKVV
jgi:type I restriction enzyme S subunit